MNNLRNIYTQFSNNAGLPLPFPHIPVRHSDGRATGNHQVANGYFAESAMRRYDLDLVQLMHAQSKLYFDNIPVTQIQQPNCI